MNRDEPCLRVRGLSFSYPDYPGLPAQELLRGLDLELLYGSMTVLLGLPDSGKTTLCRIVAGLIPRFSGGLLDGSVCLPGGELGERAPFALVEEVGLVFQNPADQLFSSRCDLEVAFALESLGRHRTEIQVRVDEALAWMGLGAMRERNPLTLSGGEKKKLLLACLHAVDPPLWLLDETLDELDSGTRTRLLEYLRARGKTVLLPSARWHELFGGYADQVVVLEGGKLRGLTFSPSSAAFVRELEGAGLTLPGGPHRSEAPLRGPGRSREQGSGQPGGRPEPEEPEGGGAGEALIEARGITFQYPGQDTFRLRVHCFTVRAAEVVALVGANGSGKTTLGRILCGLLEPQEGGVFVPEGGAMSRTLPERLNSYTGYLFQDPDLQIFLPTVSEELAYGLKLRGLDPERIRRSIDDAIARFHLPSPEVPPALMSYGARKRLQAAVCYLLERPLLVIDEGDSGLGAPEFAALLEELRGPRRGLVFITHDLRLAEQLADRVVELREGVMA